jgi:integration host factor subunit beta
LLFVGIKEILVDDSHIELRNFGIFKVKERKARKARNPRTGEAVIVPARRTVVFKPGNEMMKRVVQSGTKNEVVPVGNVPLL